jgi:hypothetical protein
VRTHNALQARVGVDEKSDPKAWSYSRVVHQAEVQILKRRDSPGEENQGERGWQGFDKSSYWADVICEKRLSNCQLKLACSNELGCNCKLPEIDDESLAGPALWKAEAIGLATVIGHLLPAVHRVDTQNSCRHSQSVRLRRL